MVAAPIRKGRAGQTAKPFTAFSRNDSRDSGIQALVHAASASCAVPIALVDLTDEDRQYFVAEADRAYVSEIAKLGSLCVDATPGADLIEIADAAHCPIIAIARVRRQSLRQFVRPVGRRPDFPSLGL
jgi:hypothetical protein